MLLLRVARGPGHLRLRHRVSPLCVFSGGRQRAGDVLTRGGGAGQVAATIMTTVTSVDNSKFWTSVLRKGLVLYLVLACFAMFRIDIDYSVASAPISRAKICS